MTDHTHRWSRWAVGYRRQCLDCRTWDEQDGVRAPGEDSTPMTDDKLRARLIEALDSIARCGSGFISPASNADALLPLVRAFMAEHSIIGGYRALGEQP